MSDHPPHPASGPAPGSAAAGAGNGAPPKRYLCPYCGNVTADARRCSSCGGHLDPLSRQATQNTMGPWQIHDAANPFRPGCSFATVRKLIQKGQITRRTILRGPTTRQFWTFADRTPSVANLLGVCHNCHAEVAPEAFLCAACGASFTPETDRQYLGLAPRRPLPGEAPADQVAHLASDGPGLYAEPRRREDEASPALETSPGRVQRPAFPADPRPPRQKRSPLAVIAIVAVAGAIGLSLGAAGALAVAASVGMIDLTRDDVEPPAAGAEGEAARPPSPWAEAGPAPESGETPAGADGAGSSQGPELSEGAPAPEAPAAEPDPAASPPAASPPGASPGEPLPEPAPAVPPRLRRLP